MLVHGMSSPREQRIMLKSASNCGLPSIAANLILSSLRYLNAFISLVKKLICAHLCKFSAFRRRFKDQWPPRVIVFQSSQHVFALLTLQVL